MQYTEIDIKLDEVVPFSEIIIAKLDLLNFDTFHEYDSGIKCYIKSRFPFDVNTIAHTINHFLIQPLILIPIYFFMFLQSGVLNEFHYLNIKVYDLIY